MNRIIVAAIAALVSAAVAVPVAIGAKPDAQPVEAQRVEAPRVLAKVDRVLAQASRVRCVSVACFNRQIRILRRAVRQIASAVGRDVRCQSLVPVVQFNNDVYVDSAGGLFESTGLDFAEAGEGVDARVIAYNC